ncbi:alpha/beta hydrolase fold domain-containing protein [Streptosporangium sp. NPDC001681]|uniref:alpha/beta hydrolase n=1 Tax=Streptosporangium sp. NPDC001681 TaxID=3154395 RepID=UPI0033213324
MPFSFNPDLMPVFAASAATGAEPVHAARDDVAALRAIGEAGLTMIRSTQDPHAEVARTDISLRTFDGELIGARWYTPATPSANPGGSVVYLHGGGMIIGSVELYDGTVAAYVADSGVPMLAIGYRVAPEHPHPAPVEDAFAGLVWLRDHAGELGIDADRIAVMGDSGGGGVGAGLVLLARDRGVAVARQILIYPMIDDRNTVPDPHLVPFAGWSYDDNYTGWHALLGDAVGGPDTPATAAAARAHDLAGLPASYLEVGELDIFRDETIEYARRLANAGTSVELHVHPGCPHGFDTIAPDVAVVQRSRADRIRVLSSF